MRLFKAAVVVFAVGIVLAVMLIVAVTSVAAQERTPQWLYEHGHIGEARAVAQKRAAANPRDAVALAWLARTQTLMGEVKGAIANAEKAVAADPNYTGGHLALAEALGEEAEKASVLRQLPMARRIKKALETAVALDPKNMDALNGLMQFYVQAPGIAGGSNEKADATAAKIGAVDTSRGYIRVLAIVHARAKRWSDLGAILAQSDRHHPSNLVAMFAAAQVLQASGADRPRAERHLKRYLSQPPEAGTPSHAAAQRLLERLQ